MQMYGRMVRVCLCLILSLLTLLGLAAGKYTTTPHPHPTPLLVFTSDAATTTTLSSLPTPTPSSLLGALSSTPHPVVVLAVQGLSSPMLAAHVARSSPSSSSSFPTPAGSVERAECGDAVAEVAVALLKEGGVGVEVVGVEGVEGVAEIVGRRVEEGEVVVVAAAECVVGQAALPVARSEGEKVGEELGWGEEGEVEKIYWTPGVWTGLLVMLVIFLILACAICCTLSIQTQAHYETPSKSKQL